jgi:hypothetical protein
MRAAGSAPRETQGFVVDPATGQQVPTSFFAGRPHQREQHDQRDGTATIAASGGLQLSVGATSLIRVGGNLSIDTEGGAGDVRFASTGPGPVRNRRHTQRQHRGLEHPSRSHRQTSGRKDDQRWLPFPRGWERYRHCECNGSDFAFHRRRSHFYRGKQCTTRQRGCFNLTVRAGGNAAFFGNASAPQINVTSANIDIAPEATLGAAGTTTAVNLTAVPNGRQVTLGGSEEGLGYTLSQAEIGRIRSAALSFAAAAAGTDAERGADLLIRALTLSGSQSNGFSSVTIATPGRARVEGAVAMTGAAPTDRLMIAATERLEVVTPTGSITMRDVSNQLGGILQLRSDAISVTDAQLATQLAANPNFAGRDEALRTNNGANTPSGFIQAGGVQLLSGGRIFIQNTGTATEFAGLTVGGGGLLIGSIRPTGNTSGQGSTQGFSFVGILENGNDVLLFNFTIDVQRM